MTTKVAPDGIPEATDVWRRYRTDGALASECLRTRNERDETARVREQVRLVNGFAFMSAIRRRDGGREEEERREDG